MILNGLLQLGSGVEFIVEVQFHVRALFELNHDLHVLNASFRVLGAMEDVMVRHEGVVTKDVLDRMEQGVLRKLVLTFTKMDLPQRDQIERTLQMEPCPLLEIDVSFSSLTTDETDGRRWQQAVEVPVDGKELCHTELGEALRKKAEADAPQQTAEAAARWARAAEGLADSAVEALAKDVVVEFTKEEWEVLKPVGELQVTHFVRVGAVMYQPVARCP